jgi:hypothetical protein
VLSHHPHAGMPPLADAPPLSRFEFWPAWRFYAPIWVWAVLLSIRHRGVRLPLLANPGLPAGGLVGEVKSQVLDLVGPAERRWVAPYISLLRLGSPAVEQARAALARARANGLDLPLVAKPELGCRGVGVRPIRSEAELAAYVAAFPFGERYLLQTLVDVEGEAGVFYLREPGEARGRVVSLTLKYFPHVHGDGVSTLEQLIHADPRAGQVPHLYLDRHRERLSEVLPAGGAFRLAFAGSHSRGAIFRDGTALVTPALEARFDEIARSIPEFWFGRFDVRFADIEAFRRGEGFTIVELNGAGAESTHIWDSRMRLRDAYATLFRQYAALWRIGARNRRRGFRPEGWRAFLARRRREREATGRYPATA